MNMPFTLKHGIIGLVVRSSTTEVEHNAVHEHMAAGWERWRQRRLSCRAMADLLAVRSIDKNSPFASIVLEGAMLTRPRRGQVTGWQGLIKVDDAVYNWLGDTDQSTTYDANVSSATP